MSYYAGVAPEGSSSAQRAGSNNGADTIASGATAALDRHRQLPLTSRMKEEFASFSMHPSNPPSYPTSTQDHSGGRYDYESLSEAGRASASVSLGDLFSLETRRSNFSTATLTESDLSVLNPPRKRRSMSSGACARGSPLDTTLAPFYAIPNRDASGNRDSFGERRSSHSSSSHQVRKAKLIRLEESFMKDAALSLNEQEKHRMLETQNSQVAEWLLQQETEDEYIEQKLAEQVSSLAVNRVTTTVPTEEADIAPVSDTASDRENKLEDGQMYFDFNAAHISEADKEMSLQARQWNDAPMYPYSANINTQPTTANEAMMKFKDASDNISVASRAATWGTRRRSEPNLADLEAMVDGSFLKKLQISKPEDKKNVNKSHRVFMGSFGRLASIARKTDDKKPEHTREEKDIDLPWANTDVDQLDSDHAKHGKFNRWDSIRNMIRHTRSKNKNDSSSGGRKSVAAEMLPKEQREQSSSISTQVPKSAYLYPAPEISVGKDIEMHVVAKSSPPMVQGEFTDLFVPKPETSSRITFPKPEISSPHITNADILNKHNDSQDEDEEIMESEGVNRIQSPNLPISNFKGFNDHIQYLNPKIESTYLLDRVTIHQNLRYKNLLELRHKHRRAVSSHSCSSGQKCAALDTSDESFDPTNMTQTQPSIEGTRYPKCEISLDSFPPGIPIPPATTFPAEFECPLCFRVKKFNKPGDWTKHVHEDISPFSCTFKNCPDTKAFKRKADWTRHENERHRHLEWWICDLEDCRHPCYRKDNFIQHLVREHKLPEPKVKTKLDEPIWWLVARCHHESTDKPQDEPCKFCGQTFTTWKKLTAHIAKHMEAISLSAIEHVGRKVQYENTAIGELEPKSTSSLDSAYFSQAPETSDQAPLWTGSSTSQIYPSAAMPSMATAHYYEPSNSIYSSNPTYQAYQTDTRGISFLCDEVEDSYLLAHPDVIQWPFLFGQEFEYNPYSETSLGMAPQQTDFQSAINSQSYAYPWSQFHRTSQGSSSREVVKNHTRKVPRVSSNAIFTSTAKTTDEETAKMKIISSHIIKEEEKDRKLSEIEQSDSSSLKTEEKLKNSLLEGSSTESKKKKEEEKDHEYCKAEPSEFSVNTLGKASPFSPQSQDGESDLTSEMESEFNEDDSQGEESQRRSDFTEPQQILFKESLLHFWAVWNKEGILPNLLQYMEKIIKCTNSGSKSNCNVESSSKSCAVASSVPGDVGRSSAKRQRSDDDGDDDSPSDNSNRQPKEPKNGGMPFPEEKLGFRLACPFRKHNPQKYNIHHVNWKTCATSSFESVARTKEHIYRKHKAAIQCVRCWIFFKNQDDLNIHLSAINICSVRSGQPIEGVNPDMISRLKSRKKFSTDQTEEDRWRRMYSIIFPNEEVPSPFFEPVLDDLAQSQESIKTPIEDFMRQELPQYLTRRLENEIFSNDSDNCDDVLNDTYCLREFFATCMSRIVHRAVEDVAFAYRQRCLPNIIPTPPSSHQFSSSQTPIRTVSRPASRRGSVSHPARQQDEPKFPQILQCIDTKAHELEKDVGKKHANYVTPIGKPKEKHMADNESNASILQESNFESGIDHGANDLYLPEQQETLDLIAPLIIDWPAEFDSLYDDINDR